MAVLYAVRSIIASIGENDRISVDSLHRSQISRSRLPWQNIGGQLIRQDDVDQLISDIKTGTLGSWDDVQRRYNDIARNYIHQRAEHALDVICRILGVDVVDDESLNTCCKIAIEAQRYIERETRASREKDYQNPFRSTMYENTSEMNEVIGTLEDNRFIELLSNQTALFSNRLA